MGSNNLRGFMERIKFLIFASFLLNFQASAKVPPPLSRYYKIPSIEEAHIFKGFGAERSLNAESIKVLVWNIKKGSLAGWRDEFTSFGKDRDLFLLQEGYFSPHVAETLDAFSHVRWDMGISFLYKIYNNTPTGSIVGADVDPSEVMVKHTEHLEPIIGTPKALTVAKYPIEGTMEDLLVISIHGINFTDLQSFRNHLKQVTDEIEKHDGPVLVAGDFNTHNFGRMSHLMTEMKRFGLSEIEFKNGEQRMKFRDYILDHGFVRGLKVKDAEVIGEAQGSDHKPMTLELSLQEK